MKLITLTPLTALLLAPLAALNAEDTPPPNILWISLEDINPILGCYGDSFARTPNIDSLAESAIRYSTAACQDCLGDLPETDPMLRVYQDVRETLMPST